jgi:hypothetical protein
LASPSPDEWKTIVATLALGVSLISLWFARRSWLQSNRPIVSAAVETHAGGEESIAYNLAVSNTGNRPAVNVRLCAEASQVEKSMAPWVANFRGPHTTYSHVMRCFSKDGEIPLLLNGKNMTNSFGYTRGDDQTFWLYGASFRLTIRYSDLEGRRYCTSQVLRIKDSAAFAGGIWEARENDS